jgi:hypothetical protein
MPALMDRGSTLTPSVGTKARPSERHAAGCHSSSAHHRIVASVASEAAADSSEPLLYAGLRLLQIGSAPGVSHLPPAAQPFRGAEASCAADDTLGQALDELATLREKLRCAEMAEARQAVRIIEIASEGMATRAATAIQAGFHGYMARSWVRRVRPRRSVPDVAATVIQASYHGSVARRAARDVRHEALRQQMAALSMQAAARGLEARRWSRDVRGAD